MNVQEELYCNTPPSLKDSEIRPLIKSQNGKLEKFFADRIFEFLLKKRFAAIRIKNVTNFEQREKKCPNIFYAPHICWWDGILGYYLCRKVFKTDTIGMMENLHAIPFLKKLGAFSIDKKSKKIILESLNFAGDSLKNGNKSLYIFPQGIIRPQDFSPIKFSSGISYIASKVNGVNLVPMAIRYNFLRSSRPEILIEVGKPIVTQEIQNRHEFTKMIATDFEKLLLNQKREIANGELAHYEPIWTKKNLLWSYAQKKCNPNKNLQSTKA